jgi:hypothetical protein
MSKEKKEEEFEFSFWGMKVKYRNPTLKGIIIVVILLIFFVALVVLLPTAATVKLFSG